MAIPISNRPEIESRQSFGSTRLVRASSALALLDECAFAYGIGLSCRGLRKAGDQEITDTPSVLRLLGQPPRHESPARPRSALVIGGAILGSHFARLAPRAELLAGSMKRRRLIANELLDRVAVARGQCDCLSAHRGGGRRFDRRCFCFSAAIRREVRSRSLSLSMSMFMQPSLPPCRLSTEGRSSEPRIWTCWLRVRTGRFGALRGCRQVDCFASPGSGPSDRYGPA